MFRDNQFHSPGILEFSFGLNPPVAQPQQLFAFQPNGFPIIKDVRFGEIKAEALNKVDASCSIYKKQRLDDITVSKFEYDWVIKPTDLKNPLESPTILTKNVYHLAWKLTALGASNRLKDLKLELVQCDQSNIQVEVECCLNCKGQQIKLIEEKFDTFSKLPIVTTTKRNLCDIEPLDSIKISLLVKIYQQEKSADVYVPKLTKDLETLLENGHLSDVSFTFGDKEIKGHKSILSTRSPVFASMFQQDMLENATNNVIIEDVEPYIFEQLLKFMYTGKLPLMFGNKKWSELLVAADKYAVDDLKTTCEENVSKNMTVNDAAEILVLADLLSLKNLKKRAIDFIIFNKSKVIETDAYREMVKTHFYLIEEMFRLI